MYVLCVGVIISAAGIIQYASFVIFHSSDVLCGKPVLVPWFKTG